MLHSELHVQLTPSQRYVRLTPSPLHHRHCEIREQLGSVRPRLLRQKLGARRMERLRPAAQLLGLDGLEEHRQPLLRPQRAGCPSNQGGRGDRAFAGGVANRGNPLTALYSNTSNAVAVRSTSTHAPPCNPNHESAMERRTDPQLGRYVRRDFTR
jgi:hypothetical protein